MYYVEYLVSYRGKRKVQSEYFKLGNTDCAAYCMNEPAVLIIQPIDKEYNDTAERQARVFSLRAKEHFLLVAYIKFLTKVEISLTEITARIREQLMGNSHLLELLSLDRRTLAKPPDWNAPRQLELFGEFST